MGLAFGHWRNYLESRRRVSMIIELLHLNGSYFQQQVAFSRLPEIERNIATRLGESKLINAVYNAGALLVTDG